MTDMTNMTDPQQGSETDVQPDACEDDDRGDLGESEEEGATRDEFTITSDSSAEWAIRRIKEAQQEIAEWKAFYADQLKKIADDRQNTINFMTSKLASYFQRVPHRKTDTQEKYELPSATLVMKTQQPEFKIDGDVLLAFLDDARRPDLIRVTREPAWGEIKKEYAVQGETMVDIETGEVIPGIAVLARPAKFDVKIKEDR